MGWGRPRLCGLGQCLGIWVEDGFQKGRGTDEATHPKGARLTPGHRGCLALWLTDVSLVQHELSFWKKLHHTALHTAIIFSV